MRKCIKMVVFITVIPAIVLGCSIGGKIVSKDVKLGSFKGKVFEKSFIYKESFNLVFLLASRAGGQLNQSRGTLEIYSQANQIVQFEFTPKTIQRSSWLSEYNLESVLLYPANSIDITEFIKDGDAYTLKINLNVKMPNDLTVWVNVKQKYNAVRANQGRVIEVIEK